MNANLITLLVVLFLWVGNIFFMFIASPALLSSLGLYKKVELPWIFLCFALSIIFTIYLFKNRKNIKNKIIFWFNMSSFSLFILIPILILVLAFIAATQGFVPPTS